MTLLLATHTLPIRVALVAAAVSLIVTIILAVAAFGARDRARKAEQTLRDVRARWAPLFLSEMSGAADVILPPIAPRERIPVLMVWNHLRQSVRGTATTRLEWAARAASFDELAGELLESGRTSERLLAVTTLGNMRAQWATASIEALLTEERPVLVEAAARALVRIDHRSAARRVAPMLVERRDWHPARVAAILGEAGADVAVAVVSRAVAGAAPKDMPRLIGYLEATRNASILPLVRDVLSRVSDPEVIAAALHAIGRFRDPGGAPIARAFARHGEWFVRVQAAAALGKTGGPDDVGLMTELLGDREWWVRYRAAQGLVGMPFMTPERLDEIAATHPDRYARDALALARAERGAA